MTKALAVRNPVAIPSVGMTVLTATSAEDLAREVEAQERRLTQAGRRIIGRYSANSGQDHFGVVLKSCTHFDAEMYAIRRRERLRAVAGPGGVA